MCEIKFYLEKQSCVKIRITNQMGRVLDILEYHELSRGEHGIQWEPKSPVVGNIFTYDLEVEGRITHNGVLIVKTDPTDMHPFNGNGSPENGAL